MNSYQIVMPNGDFMKVAADRMENVDGDLRFFQGNTVVGEARYWQAWSLIGTIDEVKPHSITPSDPTAGNLINRYDGRQT